MSDESIAGVKAALAKASEENGKTQSALGVAKDRVQQTRDILRISLEGARREEAATIQSVLKAVDELVDQAIEATILVTEQIDGYSAQL